MLRDSWYPGNRVCSSKKPKGLRSLRSPLGIVMLVRGASSSIKSYLHEFVSNPKDLRKRSGRKAPAWNERPVFRLHSQTSAGVN